MTTLPLDGVRILDLTRLLPGAFATALLVRLGADVIRIETPGEEDPLLVIERRLGGGGDFTRSLGRGTRSVAVDPGREAGRELLLRLAERADVWIESHRPGGVERTGIAYEALAARNPRLIHCALTACGTHGALAERGGHDLNLLAMSGVLSLLRPAGGPPIVPAVQIAGVGGSALPAVQAILAALFARERDGQGRQITLSVVHNLQSWLGLERSLARSRQNPGGGVEPDAGPGAAPPRSTLRGRAPCYNVYTTADRKHVALAAAQGKLWAGFCRAVGRPAWLARQFDPELRGDVQALIGDRTLAAWRRLEGASLILQPVLELDEAAELLRSSGAAAPGRELLPGVWFSGLDAARSPATAPAPASGQHTRVVLGEIGLAADEVERLAVEGVIG